MNNKEIPVIKLNDVLKFLEGERTDKPYLFVNPSGDLETFFTYKGTLVELQKMKLKQIMGKCVKEDDEESIRKTLYFGLGRGGWIVFNMGSGSDFKVNEFCGQFSFYNKTMFEQNRLFDKNYLISCNILKPEEDKDAFGNLGYWKVHDGARVFFLTTCPEEKLDDLLKTNEGLNFTIVVVK